MSEPPPPLDGRTTLVFTDGAAKGNPGPAGWGTIVLTPDGHVTELGGGARRATNNQMELAAVIEGLKFLAERDGPVAVYADSTYVLRGITGWIHGWRRKGWKTASGDPVKNEGYWKALWATVCARRDLTDGPISWHYVRGHVGTPANERADRIAVAFAAKFSSKGGRPPALYDGPLIEYEVPLLDLPDDTSLPEPRSDKGGKSGGKSGKGGKRGPKPKAYCYLSLVGGRLETHASWAACEARVKGVKGAKFKKAMKKADVPEICRGWGVTPPE